MFYALLKAVVLTVCIISVGVVLSDPNFNILPELAGVFTHQSVKAVPIADVKLPKIPELLPVKPPKLLKSIKVITLEKSNMLAFRGPVTRKSISELQVKLMRMSHRLSKNTPIFLVLDTPGGSVPAGLSFIESAQAIPQKIHTITLFAASMGFNIVQGLGHRYITPSGVLMSHRASVTGFGGQLNGEFETRYMTMMRSIQILEVMSANRLKISLKDYKKKIINEYWILGIDSKKEKVADTQVILRCGKSLVGKQKVDIRTVFGVGRVYMSNCPLVRSPISVDLSLADGKNRAHLDNLIDRIFSDRRGFVKDYISSGKFSQYFKN